MPSFDYARLRRKVLTSLALNTVIALVLTGMAGGRYFLGNLIYSQCIGACIWSTIDLLGWWLVPDQATQWRRMIFIVPLGVSLGVLAGTELGDALLDLSGVSAWPSHSGRLSGTIGFSLLIGVAISYYFMSREQLTHAREQLATADAQAQAAQRQAAEAQLKLLETQLEPHMLFNTLSNLRILIASDTARAQQMLDHLVAYLRATLGASRAGSHTLADEFERLNDYLALMAIRMGPRLHYSLDLPEPLRAQPVPGLLLQAIVENSIKHGLEPKVEGGSIHIAAGAQDGRLTLAVRDSGVGLPAGTATPDGASGFGLAQVRERLHTTYGERATLTLQAAPSGGTLAAITLPLQP
jgi:signal transduction histidine kinase